MIIQWVYPEMVLRKPGGMGTLTVDHCSWCQSPQVRMVARVSVLLFQLYIQERWVPGQDPLRFYLLLDSSLQREKKVQTCFLCRVLRWEKLEGEVGKKSNAISLWFILSMK